MEQSSSRGLTCRSTEVLVVGLRGPFHHGCSPYTWQRSPSWGLAGLSWAEPVSPGNQCMHRLELHV